MKINKTRQKDYLSIERSVKKYLEQEIDLLTMIGSVDMFASATFDNNETHDFYTFLNNSMCDIEMKYFMKGEDYPYNEEVVKLVKIFNKKLKEYRDSFQED